MHGRTTTTLQRCCEFFHFVTFAKLLQVLFGMHSVAYLWCVYLVMTLVIVLLLKNNFWFVSRMSLSCQQWEKSGLKYMKTWCLHHGIHVFKTVWRTPQSKKPKVSRLFSHYLRLNRYLSSVLY